MPAVRINEPIAQWSEGDFVQGFAFLSRKDVRQDRNGREYMDLELGDASASIIAKVWPDSPAMKGRFEAREFITFKGTVRLYREQLQLNVDFCRAVTEEDRHHGFAEAGLVPTTPEDIEDLARRLAALYPGTFERPELRRLVTLALERWGDALREHPAAKSIHHAYRGGLLEHVVFMAELAQKFCDQYRDLDRDLLLAGVLFHDLGKLRELGAMPGSEYTLEGQLIGHVILGRDMLRACVAEIAGFPEDLRLHLEHLILSHQGHREYGSPVEPMTLEAFALHSIDDLDSKLNQLRRARTHQGGLQFLRPLGRTVLLEGPSPAVAVADPATR